MHDHLQLYIAIPASLRRRRGLYQALCLAALLFLACDTAGKKTEFTIFSRHAGNTAGARESALAIDKGRTYEIGFILAQYEECLKFALTAKMPGAGIDRKDRIIISFFVIERLLDISAFPRGASGGTVYAELGRNFDHRWNRRRELTICSSREDPIKKFGPGRYKIRFTTFHREAYSFEMTIFSKQAIQFTERP